MLIMTTAESPRFSIHELSRPILKDESCFIMKSNSSWDHTEQVVRNCINGVISSQQDEDEMASILEVMEMVGLDYEEEIKTELTWNYPENESSKRASRHLSGGGLLAESAGVMCVTSGTVSNFSGSVVSAPLQEPSPPDELKRISSNPFRNKMRLILDDDNEQEVSSTHKGCVFSPTNPFSIFNSSSQPSVPLEANKTPSQCSTRPVSPTYDSSNPFSPSPRPHCFIFSLPTPALVNQSTQTHLEPQWLYNDLQCLQETLTALRMSGWYYENVSWQDSVALLQNSDPGTFLVRDSADPNFLFSLSVQTSRGPTSVRLHYIKGRFRLDAEEKLIPNMPSFESVIDLIEFYIANSEHRQRKKSRSRRISSCIFSKEQVWVDSQGQIFSNILITKPLRKPQRMNCLQHLSRIAVCGLLRRSFRSQNHKSKSLGACPTVPIGYLIDSLSLPPCLSEYLKEYPFSL